MDIDEAISAADTGHAVLIVTSPACARCAAAKEELEKIGVAVFEMDSSRFMACEFGLPRHSIRDPRLGLIVYLCVNGFELPAIYFNGEVFSRENVDSLCGSCEGDSCKVQI